MYFYNYIIAYRAACGELLVRDDAMNLRSSRGNTISPSPLACLYWPCRMERKSQVLDRIEVLYLHNNGEISV